MSRIGKQPVIIPDGVTATVADSTVTVKGAKGEMTFEVPAEITVAQEENSLVVSVKTESRNSPALWGTVRARIQNMVKGVSDGFEKKLEIHGVGYRANLKGKNLELALGYSHPITVEPPEGVEFAVEKEVITVSGYDNVAVGQAASDIRKLRKPEPYKGKGVRYQGEHVRRKVGKVTGATE